jgi:hypothetical protein
MEREATVMQAVVTMVQPGSWPGMTVRAADGHEVFCFDAGGCNFAALAPGLRVTIWGHWSDTPGLFEVVNMLASAPRAPARQGAGHIAGAQLPV